MMSEDKSSPGCWQMKETLTSGCSYIVLHSTEKGAPFAVLPSKKASTFAGIPPLCRASKQTNSILSCKNQSLFASIPVHEGSQTDVLPLYHAQELIPELSLKMKARKAADSAFLEQNKQWRTSATAQSVGI